MALIDNLEGLVRRIGALPTPEPAQADDVPETADAAPIQPIHEDTRPSLPSGFVKRVLDMRDATPEINRRGKPGYIHVSALSGLCPRQHSLMVELGIREEDRVTGAHRVMWRVGRSVEHYIREQLIGGYRAGVFGGWACLCGDVTHTGFKPHEKKCTSCRGAVDQYREMELLDHENGVTGSPDIILRYDERFIPVEIKSITGEDWKALKRPQGDHITQALGYRRLLKLAGRPVHDDVVVIYCSKHFQWGSPYKEFHVKATTSAREAMMDELFEKAREVRAHADVEATPPRWVCSSEDSSRAKNCPVKAICFARPTG